jgi:hypothetical protein
MPKISSYKADELVQKSALVAKGYLFAMYPKKDCRRRRKEKKI